MQVTIDIPEPLYRELDTLAQSEQTSLQDLVVKSVKQLVPQFATASRSVTRSVKLPLVIGNEPGPLLKNGANLNETMSMTDDEFERFTGQ